MTRSILLALVLAVCAPSLARAQDVVEGPLPAHGAGEEIAPDAPDDERAELRATLLARRRAHLAELRRYVEAGVFPRNTYADGFVNVFEDEQGHLCAVANLMAHDGQLPLVRATALGTNFIRLGDVTAGPLLDWVLGSGFTQEEIARIQEPYFEIEPEAVNETQRLEEEKRRLQGVLRGVVEALERDEATSIEIALARFTARG
jgi:hypothetical protein